MSVEAKKAKQAVIDEIRANFDKSVSIVAVDYLGITVSQADELRKQLRESDVKFKVYKNSLVKRAIEGTEYEGLVDVLKGSSAFALSEDDATAGPRIIKKAIKDFEKMEFKGGFVEGKVYDKAGVEALADIPSREELIARFLGSIQAPISKVVRTFKAIADNMPESEAVAND